MDIVFKNVVPTPLADIDLAGSSVWDQTFRIEKGRNYLLNASSGKGKSTFVNILMGLRHDYSGDVTFNGQSLKSFSMSEWSEIRTRQLANVFQTLDLFPKLNVMDNILVKNKLTDYKTEAEIKLLLEQLEIDHLSRQLTANLSMGQKQRVAIIRALCQPFEWLLLDEPFSHLDEENIQKSWQVIAGEMSNQSANAIITSLGQNHGIHTLNTLLL